MNRLIVLSGVPGSGKSYFSHLLKEKSPRQIFIISSDELRKQLLGDQRDLSNEPLIWKTYYQLAKDYSQKKDAIIILDATHAKKIYRLDSIKPYKDLYDEIDLVCFVLAKDLVLKQNREREFPIPEDALLRLIDEFEFPDKEEASFYHHIDIVNSNEIAEIIKRYC